MTALAACKAGVQASPTIDQKVISSVVAATINAASTATQRAALTSHPPQISTSTQAPTLAETPLPSATSTVPPVPATPLPSTPEVMVAYTKYNDVYLWTPNLGITRLTDMHDVVSVHLSQDGALIAFKRQDPAEVTLQELWVVNTSGNPNSLQLVTSDDLAALVPPDASSSILGYGVLDFTWRPGTHQLAYSTLILHEGPGFGPNHDLRLVDAATMQKTTLFDTGQGGMFYYSPDGSQIALSNPESISLVNADGNNLRRDVLTYPGVITYSEYEYHPHPIWSADSASLMVTIPPHDPLGDPTPLTGLWRIPADGSPAVLLGSVPAIPFAWPDNAISPDLALVAYSSDAIAPDPNIRDLHVSNLDGTGDRIYANGESLEFNSWSPDSQHFIYAIQGGENEGLYIGSLDESPIVLIEDPHRVRDIQWQDDSSLIFLINNNDQWGLLLSNLDADILAFIDTIPDASPDFDLKP
ncbi:MAG TPA: hypothetical protein VLD65_08905 [Anaerolineales bacterium]|nr:hypothetical protein [Anaerolineales bacterium]